MMPRSEIEKIPLSREPNKDESEMTPGYHLTECLRLGSADASQLNSFSFATFDFHQSRATVTQPQLEVRTRGSRIHGLKESVLHSSHSPIRLMSLTHFSLMSHAVERRRLLH
jgi:hypothetical protein